MTASLKNRLIILRYIDMVRQLPFNGLHWCVLIVSSVITLTAWQLSLRGVQERNRIKFDLQADYAIEMFELQLNRYANMLASGAGFVAGSQEIHPEQWRRFTQRISLEEQFPAVGGMGVIYRVDANDLDEFVDKQRLIRADFAIRPPVDQELMKTIEYVMPLTLIAPEKLEESVAGLDVAREARRRDAIERSIRTGSVQITAPIRPDSLQDPGFVMIAPIFNSNRPETEALRELEFIGAVVAPLITRHLANGILDSGFRQVALKVSDDSEIMYNELTPDNADVDPQPLLTSSRTVSVFGRDWDFEIHSTRSFRSARRNPAPTLILVGGIVIDLLLVLLFMHMSRANNTAIAFGRAISRKYERKSDALQHSNLELEARNKQLESFSYVLSHDLKTPLRAIGFLAERMEEDLDDDHPGPGFLPEPVDYLKRIRKQVTLANNLVTGVLQYSGLDSESESPTTVNVSELLESIRLALTVESTQLQVIGELPTFETCQTQLTQVFMNLIGNGYKYHRGSDLAVVTVGIETSPLKGYYRFSVSDNGPGIEPIHHEKIFEPFSTLQPKDHSMSSGVGLAIVKKLVNKHGGSIEIVSAADHGASFSFDWPCSVKDQTHVDDRIDLPRAA